MTQPSERRVFRRVKETFHQCGAGLLLLVLMGLPLAAQDSTRVVGTGTAQAALADSGPRVFVECTDCDEDFLRTELTFVDLVRDRLLADVTVMVTSLQTASGGRRFTIQARDGNRSGRSRREGLVDTLRVSIRPDATANDQRVALVRAIKVALLPWIRESLELAHLDLQYRPPGATRAPTTRVDDPWRQWVFRIGGSGSFAGDDNYRSAGGDANLSATRITEQIKLEWTAEGSYNRERFRLSDSSFAVSIRQRWSTRVFLAQALGPHWSAGTRGSLASSIFQNTRLDGRASAALEFSLFPYAEATQRQVILRYTVGLRAARYVDTTIFGRLGETRPLHDVTMATDVRQPWGSLFGMAVWSQYLHDGRRRRLSVDVGADYRIVAGLSVFGGITYARIADQLNIPGGNLTDRERLLRLRELQSGSSASLNVGLSYTFGSVYSTVVNPRFRL